MLGVVRNSCCRELPQLPAVQGRYLPDNGPIRSLTHIGANRGAETRLTDIS